MSKKPEKAGDHPKPSLLLQQPKSFLTWSGDTDNIFMPVAVVEEERKDLQAAILNTNDGKKNSLPVTSMEHACSSTKSDSSQAFLLHQPPRSFHNVYHQPQSEVMPFQTTSAVPSISKSEMLSNKVIATMHSSCNVPIIATFGEEIPLASPSPISTEMSMKKISYKPYEPVKEHWLFKDVNDNKQSWIGFSHSDSAAIEEAYKKVLRQPAEEIIVPTNGNRHDVYLKQRKRKAFYWKDDDNDVLRGTYFYKTEKGWIPYDESISILIEKLIEECSFSESWSKSLTLPDANGTIVIENVNSVLHYIDGSNDSNADETRTSLRLVHRGMPEDAPILPEEIPRVDHVVLVVQGIGSFCDLSFRTVSKCVDGFRDIAARLTRNHFKEEVKAGKIGKIEFLPFDWHSTLHTDDVGFDRRMASITLPSLPLVRNFTNDTLLDILLYSSPMYGETIINTVVTGLNNLFHHFVERNPQFRGGVSVAGHSLGSLILFDILANPKLAEETSEKSLFSQCNSLLNNQLQVKISSNISDVENDSIHSSKDPETLESTLKSLGLDEYINLFLEAQFSLNYKTSHMMHLTSKELTDIGLPAAHQNIFLSYLQHLRNEVNISCCGFERNPRFKEEKTDFPDLGMPQLNGFPKNSAESKSLAKEDLSSSFSLTPLSSSLCPLNQTRAPFPFSILKLDFQPACFFALGSPIAMFLAVRGFSTISEDFHFKTCPSFFNIFHPYDPVAFRIEPLIDPDFSSPPVLIPHHKGRKRMHLEIRDNLAKIGAGIYQTVRYTWNCINMFHNVSLPTLNENDDDIHIPQEQTTHVPADASAERIKIGALNGGRRIDYVLQEKPYEAIINQYLFSLTSHATYWNSDDTVLMMLKELYALHGVTLRSDKEDLADEHVSELPLFNPATSESIDAVHPNVNNSQAANTTSTPKVYQSDQNHPPIDIHSEGVNSVSNSTNSSQSHLPSFLETSQCIRPPPLFGFIKKSPFRK